MKKKTILQLAFFILCSISATAQIVVTNNQAPNNLVQNVLLGNGVTATNITYNGSAVNAQTIQTNVTFFNAANTTFPLASGVLLTTGQGSAAVGPNNSGSFTLGGTPLVTSDADLNAIAAGSVTNGAILEFDFVPSGDTVSFRYVFGSDEYPEFSPSTFNDAFGFFLSGPGIAGPYTNGATNIALIPGTTTPVTINNVGDQSNTQYYVDNVNGAGYGTAIQYDGTTVILTAVAQVICGQTYHIKLAICNVGDQSYDSGVFIEADSFSSEAVDIAVATVSGDTSVVEGCTNATFIFTRPITQTNDTLIVNYGISGSAIQGVDYNNLPNPVIFPPGEDTVIITLTPFQDGISDSPEFVTLTALTVTECGDSIITEGTLYILDGPNLQITELDPFTACANDSVLASAFASGGYGPYTYSWSFGNQTGDTAFLPISSNGTIDYYVTATDQCGFTGTDTITVTMNQTLAIDEMIEYQASACANDGAVSGTAVGITGQPQYHWEGPNTGGPFQIDASVLQNLPSGYYVFTVTDDVCSVTDSIFLTQAPPPFAAISQSVTAGCAPFEVEFDNNSQNATAYSWNFGNGNTLNTSDSTSQTQIYNADATITLIASNGLCADTATVSVSVSICGCTDPNAINYNPMATVSDNSCIYPNPSVTAPNVFTPNGDQDNDFFQLSTMHAVSIELVITNRWGNLMFEATGTNPAWDGTVNGNPASAGVYFYQYTVTGITGEELIGHGFLELIRQ